MQLDIFSTFWSLMATITTMVVFRQNLSHVVVKWSWWSPNPPPPIIVLYIAQEYTFVILMMRGCLAAHGSPILASAVFGFLGHRDWHYLAWLYRLLKIASREKISKAYWAAKSCGKCTQNNKLMYLDSRFICYISCICREFLLFLMYLFITSVPIVRNWWNLTEV